MYFSTKPEDFDACIKDCHATLKLFLNNHFTEAKKRMEPW